MGKAGQGKAWRVVLTLGTHTPCAAACCSQPKKWNCPYNSAQLFAKLSFTLLTLRSCGTALFQFLLLLKDIDETLFDCHGLQ